MGFAFVLLAFSIGWGAIYQPLGSRIDTAELDEVGVRTVHFPVDGPAIIETEGGEFPVVNVRAKKNEKRTWATALRASQK